MKISPETVLILSDYDGTFTGGDGAPHPANCEAVERFRREGGRFAFSTGRLPAVMKKICPDFLSLSNAPLIMANGAILLDPETGERLSFLPFDGEDGRREIEDFFTAFPGGEIGVYTADEVYHAVKPGEPLPPPGPWIKINHFLPNEAEAVACRERLTARFGSVFHAFRSGRMLTEAVSRSATKGTMVGRVRDLLAGRGRPVETVIAVGDFENDLDLLAHADLAFCPENAVPEVKAISRLVLCHHKDGTVADLIERIEKGGL